MGEDSGKGQPPAGGTGDPPAPPAGSSGDPPPGQPPEGGQPAGGDPPPSGGGGEPFAVFPTAEAFNDRVGRAARSLLQKELGVSDLGALKEQLGNAAKLAEAEEKRRKEEMSEIERAQAEAAEAKAKAEQLETERDQAALEAHITKICAKRGIRDVGYAQYKILGKLEELPEDQDLDEEAYLDELLQDERQKVALGVQDPAPPPEPPKQVDTPPTTTPAGAQHQQPAAPKPGAPGEKTAFELSEEEWRQKKAALGIR